MSRRERNPEERARLGRGKNVRMRHSVERTEFVHMTESARAARSGRELSWYPGSAGPVGGLRTLTIASSMEVSRQPEIPFSGSLCVAA
jgi:hypothetical protein